MGSKITIFEGVVGRREKSRRQARKNMDFGLFDRKIHWIKGKNFLSRLPG